MTDVIPHYRAECVSDFNLADSGSINLKEYMADFGDTEKIQSLKNTLKEELNDQGITFENAEKIAHITQDIQDEVSRAIFPERYLRYGTSIFGSARLREGDQEYKDVVDIARGLVSEIPTHIITGGGPGIMEAATVGLKEAVNNRKKNKKNAVAQNIGLPVSLPFEEVPNQHLDYSNTHKTFGSRLNEFADKSNSVISWDGGLGTDLENSFIYQLKQVNHMESDTPLILKDVWKELQDAKLKQMYYQRIQDKERTLVSPEDLEMIKYAQHPDDAIHAVIEHYKDWKERVFDKLDEESQDLILSRKE